MTTKWRFEDVNQIFGGEIWEFEINPEEGGQPLISHNMTIHQHTGPWPSVAMQQGRPITPRMPFSGRVLTQEQYQAFERWYMYRILLDLVDDLGRRFRGVLIRWDPSRVRKPYDPWYHEYQAEFVIWAGQNASGEMIYGHMEESGIDDPVVPPEDDITDDPLDAPVNLQGEFITPEELDLSWRKVEGAVSYRIERDSVVIETGIIGTVYTDVNINIDQDYTYRVASVDAFGISSEWSAPFEVLAPTEQDFLVLDDLDVALSEDAQVTVIEAVTASDAIDVGLTESAQADDIT